MLAFPADWEDLLWQAVRAEVGTAATELAVLVPAIQARTRRYTDDRARLGEPMRGAAAERDLAARALFFTVADAAKIAIPLAELEGRGLLPAGPLRVLDVGAGPGAMTLGLLAARPQEDVAITAVDRDARALAILRRVAAALPGPPSLTARVADVTAPLPPGPFDLVLAGSVTNELQAAARAPFLRALLERLADGGAVIVIEPALRETARALHALRDELVRAGHAHVFAPCTHEQPCPALTDVRDWCHEDRTFRPPPRLASLMNRTGLRDGGLKLAYLTLRREPVPLVAPVPGRRALRVVSGALDSKGVVERIVCGADGRRRVRILSRERSRALAALSGSRRGDVLLEDDAGEVSLPASPRSSASPGPESPDRSPPASAPRPTAPGPAPR